jgi:2-C-methyl-D-erythritol 4-phosphate cytidylyltransferase
MNCVVIIPAAGLGKRFNLPLPKQFTDIDGMPILIHTIKIFDTLPSISSIIIAANQEWIDFTQSLITKYNVMKPSQIIKGGKIRQDSVNNALKSKLIKSADIVLVHDAVRPFTSQNLVNSIINTAIEYGAAIPALIPRDTIKLVNKKGFVVRTLDRSKLCSVQTPQGFRQEIILESYKYAYENRIYSTDDASLIEKVGYTVKTIPGEETNIKITTQNDLKITI